MTPNTAIAPSTETDSSTSQEEITDATSLFSLIHKQRREYILSQPIQNHEMVWVFRKAMKRLKGVLLFESYYRHIQRFGTRSGLLDASDAYKLNLEDILRTNQIAVKKEVIKKEPLGNVLHPELPILHAWNMVILLILLYSFTVTPFLIAFEEVDSSSPWFIMDVCIDCLFFVDIVLTFNTAFHTSSGKLVTSRREIAKSYLQGMFIIDCASTFPVYLITLWTNSGNSSSNSLVRFLRLSKLMKLTRATKMIKILNYFSRSESMGKCLKVMKKYDGITRLISALNMVGIIAHFTACMWYFIAKLDDFSPNTWVVRFNFQDQSNFTLYLISFYWAITTLTTVGFGDIYAFTSMEMIMAILWMLFGVGFYSFVIGTLSSMMTGIDAESAQIGERLNLVDLFAKDTSLPIRIVKKVEKEVRANAEGITMNQDEKDGLLSGLSKSLQIEVAMNMYNCAVQKINFFTQIHPIALIYVAKRLEYRKIPARKVIYSEGDTAEEVFFITEGRVRFRIGSQKYVFKTLVAGSLFGEGEVMEGIVREFSVETDNDCEFLVLGKSGFISLIRNFPDVSELLEQIVKNRRARDKDRMKDVVSLLEAVEMQKMTASEELVHGRFSLRSREMSRKSVSGKLEKQRDVFNLSKAPSNEILDNMLQDVSSLHSDTSVTVMQSIKRLLRQVAVDLESL